MQLTDAAAILLAVSPAAVLGLTSVDGGLMQPASLRTIAVCLAIALVWFLGLLALGCHDRRTIGAGRAEYRRLVSATLIVFALVGVANMALGTGLGRQYAIALPVGLLALTVSRRAWSTRRTETREGVRELRRTLVVGTSTTVASVVQQLQSPAAQAYKVIGAVVDGPAPDFVGGSGLGVPVVADQDSVSQAVRNLNADTVIVAGQPSDAEFVRRLGWDLEGTGADLLMVTPLTGIPLSRLRFRPVDELPFIQIELARYDGVRHAVKRLIDLIGAGLALIVLSPLFLLVALWIKLDDGGPVFFAQTRVGKGGAPFRMLKFRSMVPDAESRLLALREQGDDGNGILFKLKQDPRVTRAGRFLRKHSFDELPQFWNVLRGQMSLVGPRPPLPREVDEYARHERRRLNIRPGLTGVWQVSGRSDLSWEEGVGLDLQYVENWSLLGDFAVLLRTVLVVLMPQGAY